MPPAGLYFFYDVLELANAYFFQSMQKLRLLPAGSSHVASGTLNLKLVGASNQLPLLTVVKAHTPVNPTNPGPNRPGLSHSASASALVLRRFEASQAEPVAHR
jgi:hypothetical protein